MFITDTVGLIDKTVSAVEVCRARRKAQGGKEETENVPSRSPSVQVQTVIKAHGPEAIERLAQKFPSARANFSEFRIALSSLKSPS